MRRTTMINEIWQCEFEVERLNSRFDVAGESLSLRSWKSPDPSLTDRVHGNAVISSGTSLLSDQVINKMSEGLEAVFSLEQRFFSSVKAQNPVLVNAEALGAAGQARQEAANMPVFMNITGVVEMPWAIMDLWEQYQSAVIAGRDEITVPIRWFVRSVKAGDSVDRFMNAWVTFEMLYNGLVGPASDVPHGVRLLLRNDIPTRIKRDLAVSRHVGELRQLGHFSLIKPGRTTDWGQELKNAIESNSGADRILEKAIRAMSVVRNGLFHGDRQARDAELSYCVPFLIEVNSRIIKCALEQL
jgi:hypothetical protein